ncbi:hypothetical protein [Microbacterium sp. NC79]|uniref:hypothetical protein n=1 Tax=Microbacterium sp. NC79 TaxID=2851009 RepID=UPI001C2C160C|nr:hypothetical protein [Microbacterium sp. NC79]MBV0893968.1 hypothetical protein [Microbacterium sp. NC79]
MRISRMVAVGGIASMLALAGCTSTPDEPLPVPTSAPSTTPPEYTPGLDAEADVEAAIKTYEAYVEASNNLVIADRETWDPVLELLLEDYKASSITTYEGMAERGEVLEGEATIVSAELDEALGTVLRIHVCTDFSEALIRNADGTLIGSVEDYGVQSMNVVLQADGTAQYSWRIGFFGESDRPCS